MLDVRAGGLGVFALTEAGVARIDSPTGAAGRMRPTPGAQALFVGDKARLGGRLARLYRIDAQGGVRARTDLPAACAQTHALAAFAGSLWVSCGGSAKHPGGEVVALRPGDGRVLRRLGFERPGDLIPFNGALRVVDITTENGTGPPTYRLVPVYRNGAVGQPEALRQAPQTFEGRPARSSTSTTSRSTWPPTRRADRARGPQLERRREGLRVARQGRALPARAGATRAVHFSERVSEIELTSRGAWLLRSPHEVWRIDRLPAGRRAQPSERLHSPRPIERIRAGNGKLWVMARDPARRHRRRARRPDRDLTLRLGSRRAGAGRPRGCRAPAGRSRA